MARQRERSLGDDKADQERPPGKLDELRERGDLERTSPDAPQEPDRPRLQKETTHSSEGPPHVLSPTAKSDPQRDTVPSR